MNLSKNIKQNSFWLLFLLIQVISYGLYPVLIYLSKENDVIKYSSLALNFLIEFIKLVVSMLLFLFELLKQKYFEKLEIKTSDINNHQAKFRLSAKDALFYLTPAVFYYFNNNLSVHMLLYMDSNTFQILSNLKIFTTAILYHLLIKKIESKNRWLSIFLLFFVGLFYVFGNVNSNPEDIKEKMFVTYFGLLLILIQSLISGLSSVYNEYLLKRNFKCSIHSQNIYLYVFGCCLNLTFFYSSNSIVSILNGFNAYTWILILSQVFTGLSMSIVMKYWSNITRLFIISSSLLVTAILSLFLECLRLNFYYIISFILIFVSLILNK